MLEELKELQSGDMLTIDDVATRQMTNVEDYQVQNIRIYSQEEGEIILIDLDGFWLVGHTFNGDPRYYVYELNSEGDAEDLENDGFRLIFCEDGSLPDKLYAGRKIPYRSIFGPFYNMNIDRDDRNPDGSSEEISICEYRGKSKQFGHMLIEQSDTTLILYQGFRISEESIVL